MKEYLRMSDVFGVVGVKVRESNGRHVMCEDILAANCFCADSAEYSAHAINSHDELVEINKELLSALDNLINDMRLRAKLEGDVDSDGAVILNCGNGVLFAATKAIENAKR